MKYGLEQFRLALSLLTVIPVAPFPEATPERLGRSMALLPVAGLLLGLVLVVLNSLLGLFLPRVVLDCLLLLILIVLAGSLPLDGVSDLINGLRSEKQDVVGSSDVKPSGVGAVGVVGLALLFLFKYLCLLNLPIELKPAGLVFMLVSGCWVQVVLAASCRSLRGRGGASFQKYTGERELLIACASLVVMALVLFGLPGIFLIFLLGIVLILLIKYIEMRFGGVTRKLLRASAELIEVLALLLVLIIA